MRSAGIGVWVDEGGIHGASLWGQEIVDAIDASKVMVLMISDSSITSDNVVKELSIASEEKKPILPVYLQRSQLPKSMRYQLAGIQHIEFFEEQEDEAFQSMLVSLSRLGVSAGGAETKQDSLSKTVLGESSNLDEWARVNRQQRRHRNRPSGACSHWPCFGVNHST